MPFPFTFRAGERIKLRFATLLARKGQERA